MTNPLKIGILGCSSVAEYALVQPSQQDAGINIIAAASRNPSASVEYARRNKIPKVVSYEALISDPEIEAIYNGLPNSMHCDWTIKALKAGKHVLCEKPLASNAKEARLMIESAAKENKLLVEAFHWRYHPIADRIKVILDSGILGRITSADVRFLIPEELVGENDIRRSYQLGGGCTMDAGCYCINFLRYFLGEPIQIKMAKAVLREKDIDVSMHVEMEFPNQCIGRFYCTHDSDSGLQADACIEAEYGRLRVLNPFAPSHGNYIELTVDGNTSREEFTLKSSWYYQAKAFVSMIRTGATTITSATDSIANMQVIDDIYRHTKIPVRGS